MNGWPYCISRYHMLQRGEGRPPKGPFWGRQLSHATRIVHSGGKARTRKQTGCMMSCYMLGSLLCLRTKTSHLNRRTGPGSWTLVESHAGSPRFWPHLFISVQSIRKAHSLCSKILTGGLSRFGSCSRTIISVRTSNTWRFTFRRHLAYPIDDPPISGFTLTSNVNDLEVSLMATHDEDEDGYILQRDWRAMSR